jgi:hypothetical protein
LLNNVSTLCVNYLNNNSFWFFILESVTSECVPLKQRRIKTSTFIFFFSQTNYSSFFNFLFHLIINKTLLRQHMASFFNTDYSYDHILLKNFCKSIRHWILFHKEANMTKKILFFSDRVSRFINSAAHYDRMFCWRTRTHKAVLAIRLACEMIPSLFYLAVF